MSFLMPSKSELQAMGDRLMIAQKRMEKALNAFSRKTSTSNLSHFDASVVQSLHDIQSNIMGLIQFINDAAKNPSVILSYTN